MMESIHGFIATAQASFVASLPPIGTIIATMTAVMIAALLRGFTGFGFALAAVPLMGLSLPPGKAVPVAVLLQLLGGLSDVRRNHRDCHWGSLRWLIVGMVAGSPFGALMLSAAPAPVARIVIAAITAIAIYLLGRGFTLDQVPSRLVTMSVGVAAGVFNGLAAMPGPPAVMYYMSGPFSAAAARASLLVFFLATSISAAISIAMVGLASVSLVWLSLIALPIMLVGTRIGELGFRRGSDQLHRRISIASLGAAVLISALKGVSELL